MSSASDSEQDVKKRKDFKNSSRSRTSRSGKKENSDDKKSQRIKLAPKDRSSSQSSLESKVLSKRKKRRNEEKCESPQARKPRWASSVNTGSPEVCHCLGVFGLSTYTQERDLKHVFQEYGDLEDIVIIYDRQSGRSKGYGFVYFKSTADAIEARSACQGLELDGRLIRVDFSLTTAPHQPTPGRYLGRSEAACLGDRFYRDQYNDFSFYRSNGRGSHRQRDRNGYYERDSYRDSYQDDCRSSYRDSYRYSRRHRNY